MIRLRENFGLFGSEGLNQPRNGDTVAISFFSTQEIHHYTYDGEQWQLLGLEFFEGRITGDMRYTDWAKAHCEI